MHHRHWPCGRWLDIGYNLCEYREECVHELFSVQVLRAQQGHDDGELAESAFTTQIIFTTFGVKESVLLGGGNFAVFTKYGNLD